MEKGNNYEEGKLYIVTNFLFSLHCLLLYSKSTMLLIFQEAAQMLESGSIPDCKCLQTFLYNIKKPFNYYM
jgi:hypothetical protein